MNGRLEGRIAIVTGGASGIGRATAMRFVREGADVLAVDVNGDGLAETAEMAGNGPGRCATFVADVTAETAPEDSFAACEDTLGLPHILINNAGIGAAKPAHDTTDENLDRFLDVNLRALFRFSRAGVRVFRRHPTSVDRAIVNLASIFGMRGFPGSSAYSATKAAVIGLTQNMAADYGPEGIRVNAIAPGLIVTPMTAARLETNPFYTDALLNSAPIRRAGRPEDIASAITFLVSDDATYVTGQTLAVDGGWATTKFRPLPAEPYA